MTITQISKLLQCFHSVFMSGVFPLLCILYIEGYRRNIKVITPNITYPQQQTCLLGLCWNALTKESNPGFMSPIPQMTYWKAQLPYGSEKNYVCEKNAAGQDIGVFFKDFRESRLHVLKWHWVSITCFNGHCHIHTLISTRGHSFHCHHFMKLHFP